MEKFLVFVAYFNDYIYRALLIVGMFLLLYLLGINYVLALILLIIMVLFALLRFILTENYDVKGIMFEKKIKVIIEKKMAKEKHFFIRDCLFKSDNEYTQVDGILVTQKAIFILEMKNYTGWIYGKEIDQYWTQVKGRYKNSFYNPILQNYKHIKLIKQILNLFESIPVYNIIVFSNDATLKNVNLNSDNVHIVKDFDLYGEISYIEKNLNSVIGDKSFQYISDMLIKNNIIDKNQRDDYYREISRKHINNY